MLFEKLDEKEMFGLFTKANPNRPIEIVLKMDENRNNVQLVFKQDNEEILLKKANFETWIYEKFKP
ncbi:MAG: hypothetical protein QM535_05670 [Limnohabitans sp.]|nr:hypothetical protein [Limnohabitans sp.]